MKKAIIIGATSGIGDWGNIVYSSTNYQNNWNGKDTSGKELVDGVYTYKLKTLDGKLDHGYVHLVR